MKTYNGLDAYNGSWGNYNNYVKDPYGNYIYSADPHPHYIQRSTALETTSMVGSSASDTSMGSPPHHEWNSNDEESYFSFNHSNIGYYNHPNGTEEWYYK